MTETPTAVWRSWFPTLVRLPDGTRLAKAKVYATDAGLLVYVQRTGVELVFQSPILLDKTPAPGTDYASQQRGHVIVTEAGNVTVTKGGGCSCGAQALKTLAPAWAAIERQWGV